MKPEWAWFIDDYSGPESRQEGKTCFNYLWKKQGEVMALFLIFENRNGMARIEDFDVFWGYDYEKAHASVRDSGVRMKASGGLDLPVVKRL